MRLYLLLLLAVNEFDQCWGLPSFLNPEPLNTPSTMMLFRDALKRQNPHFNKWDGNNNYCQWSGVECKNGDVDSM